MNIKRHIAKLFTGLSLVLILTGPAPALAACPTGTTAKDQVLSSVGNETGTDCSDSGVATTAHTAVNILSFVAGIAAVIMIILSGFRYITSGGDSNRVTGAKNTLIYALIGVAIAVLTQFLVHFVLSNAANSVSG